MIASSGAEPGVFGTLAFDCLRETHEKTTKQKDSHPTCSAFIDSGHTGLHQIQQELASLTHISEAVNVADGLTKTKSKLNFAIFEGMSGKWSVPVRSEAVAKARPGAWQEDFVKLRNPNSDEC